jgi:hypothetical protein
MKFLSHARDMEQQVSAASAMRCALRDSNARVREGATNALLEIAPGALTNDVITADMLMPPKWLKVRPDRE